MKNFPKKYKIGDILLLEWFDAYTAAHGWVDPKTLKDQNACQCFSIGLFIGKTQEGDILLAGSWDTKNIVTEGTVNNVSGRPLGMIQKVTLIRKGKKS